MKSENGMFHENNASSQEVSGPAENTGQTASASSHGLDIPALTVQIEFVRKLSNCESREEFCAHILKVLKDLGFSGFHLVRLRESGMVETGLSSLPNELLEEYHTEGLFEMDMVLDYLKAGNQEPLYLSSIAEVINTSNFKGFIFEKNKELHELYRRFAINDSYIMPVRSVGDNALFSVVAKNSTASEFKALVENCESILKLLADAVHYIGNERSYISGKAKREVNVKSLRLLTVMAHNDLSLSQAARKLCISLDTANKHMAAGKKSFCTRSQANAVFLAIKEGLIGFDR